MTTLTNPTRRSFLQYSSLGLLTLSSFPVWLGAMEGMGNMPAMPKMAPNKASPDFKPDVEIELTCKPGSVSILPGQATRVQQYFGRLIKGPENALTTLPASYLGPLMRFQQGQKVRITLRNEMTEPTITHWHGLNVPALMDGHPVYAISQGEAFVYEFEIRNRAGMILYHPHTHGVTGEQVYHGLAGAMLINDAEEHSLQLPSGEYEIPIVIQDRLFDEKNQLVYAQSMHDRMTGFHGDRILVNGHPDFSLDVASRAYRLRVLNGSNARIYKLAWDDGSPVTVVGVDGGLLEQPVVKPYVMLAPGERLDVWADFSGRAVGSQLVMRSRPFTGVLPKMAERMMRGEMGGMMGGMDHQGEGGKKQEGGQAMGGMGMGGMMGMMGGGMGGHQGENGKKQEGGQGMGMMGGMGGMHGMMGNKIPVGSDYPIFTVRVTRQVSDSPSLPSHLSKITRYRIEDTANPGKPVPIGISEGPMSMLINGRPYAYNDIQPNERIPFDTVQLMEIFHAHGGEGGHGGGAAKGAPEAAAGGHAEGGKPAEGQTGAMQQRMMGGGMGMMGGMGGQNTEAKKQEGGHAMGGMGMMGGMGGQTTEGKPKGEGQAMGGMAGGGMGMMGGMGGMGMMMSMAHPIHLHEQPFQIVSRTIGTEEAEDYATVHEGFIDSGWKDTVLVMPGERVKIIKPFKDYKGLFMVHCHNLEHEDMGMMREFLVE